MKDPSTQPTKSLAFCVKCGVDVDVQEGVSECPRCGFDTVVRYAVLDAVATQRETTWRAFCVLWWRVGATGIEQERREACRHVTALLAQLDSKAFARADEQAARREAWQWLAAELARDAAELP